MLMRRLLIPILASTISFSALAQDCDGSCLAGFLDDYSSALVANPPNEGYVSLERRYSRNDPITVANSYFDGNFPL